MKVTMVGSGHVGLVTGARLSEMGSDVFRFDVDSQKIDGLNNGRVPINEPGLAELIHRNVGAGHPLIASGR
jgi:UDPglucose 6-dehydrogenase